MRHLRMDFGPVWFRRLRRRWRLFRNFGVVRTNKYLRNTHYIMDTLLEASRENEVVAHHFAQFLKRMDAEEEREREA